LVVRTCGDDDAVVPAIHRVQAGFDLAPKVRWMAGAIAGGFGPYCVLA
jgi:hypothetical protein